MARKIRETSTVLAMFLTVLVAGTVNAGVTAPTPGGASPSETSAAGSAVGESEAANEEQPKGELDTVEKMVRESQNPLSKVYSLPLQGHINMGIGPKLQTQYVMNIQPVVPVPLSDKLLMINRLILPFMSNPGYYTGGDRQWGLSDTSYTAWLSPNKPGTFLWGAGVACTLPTATEDSMGNDKWAFGPSFVMVIFKGKFVMGGVFQNTWSTGGSGRHDTNNFFSQIFINYNIGGGWYVSTMPIFTADWNAEDTWVVPIGATIGKGFKLGGQMIDFNLGYYHNVVRPDAAPRSKVLFTLKFLWARK
ncbi:MAG TPA: neuromedin U [Acidobacteria bacterium]|nr:neuromedin U [Acidobacteriota bacterium]